MRDLERSIAKRDEIERRVAGANQPWIMSRGLDQYESWLKPTESVGMPLHAILRGVAARFKGKPLQALDGGAGIGKALFHLQALHPEFRETHGISLEAHEPVQIDPGRDRYLKKLAKDGLGVHDVPNPPTLHVADVLNLPFKKGQFHFLMSNRGAFWYAPMVDKAPGVLLSCFKEADRVVADGGVMVVHSSRVGHQQRQEIKNFFRKNGSSVRVVECGRMIPNKGHPSPSVQHEKVVLPNDLTDTERESNLKRILKSKGFDTQRCRPEFWNVWYVEKAANPSVIPALAKA